MYATYISFIKNSGSVPNNFKIHDTKTVNVYFISFISYSTMKIMCSNVLSMIPHQILHLVFSTLDYQSSKRVLYKLYMNLTYQYAEFLYENYSR